jgi:hypothetical protein
MLTEPLSAQQALALYRLADVSASGALVLDDFLRFLGGEVRSGGAGGAAESAVMPAPAVSAAPAVLVAQHQASIVSAVSDSDIAHLAPFGVGLGSDGDGEGDGDGEVDSEGSMGLGLDGGGHVDIGAGYEDDAFDED